MMAYEMRTYEFHSVEAAETYLQIWIKHIESLSAFDIATHGVFSIPDEPSKVVALVSYAKDADPAAVSDAYMASEGFRSDMAGFDKSQIASVTTVLLRPAPFSPLR